VLFPKVQDSNQSSRLPIYDAVATVNMWRKSDDRSRDHSRIFTLSTENHWYKHDDGLSTWKEGLVLHSDRKLKLSKAMAVSGGAVSFKMGDYDQANPILAPFQGLIALTGASMGGWIRTGDSTVANSLSLFSGLILFTPIVVLFLLDKPGYKIIAWTMFILYFMMWSIGRHICPRLGKYFLSMHYVFEMSMLVNTEYWGLKMPSDRIYMSDGAGKDNYGLASLILRRRCKKILICEGAYWSFPLAGLLEAFHYADRYSDYEIEFFWNNYETVTLITKWEKIPTDVYIKLSFQEEKQKKIDQAKKKTLSKKIFKGRDGKNPCCWVFRVKYGPMKKDFVQKDEEKYGSPLERITEAFLWFVMPPQPR